MFHFFTKILEVKNCKISYFAKLLVLFPLTMVFVQTGVEHLFYNILYKDTWRFKYACTLILYFNNNMVDFFIGLSATIFCLRHLQNCEYVCPYPMYGKNCISECHCSEDNCSPAYGCLSIFIFSTPFFVSLLLSNYILKTHVGF